MTIDEAIAHEREVSNGNFDDRVHCTRCSEFYEHLEELLEELKMYKSLAPRELVSEKQKNDRAIEYNKGFDYGFKTGYNKAVDDFMKFASDMPTVEEEDGTIRPMWLEEMAEQLKKGER